MRVTTLLHAHTYCVQQFGSAASESQAHPCLPHVSDWQSSYEGIVSGELVQSGLFNSHSELLAMVVSNKFPNSLSFTHQGNTVSGHFPVRLAVSVNTLQVSMTCPMLHRALCLGELEVLHLFMCERATTPGLRLFDHSKPEAPWTLRSFRPTSLYWGPCPCALASF